jgi:putative addiction module component (TIGR02574 family)
MHATIQSLGIDQLPIADRIRLANEIWDSIDAEASLADPIPPSSSKTIPDWLPAFIDQRLAQVDSSRHSGMSWDDAKELIRNRRKGMSE